MVFSFLKPHKNVFFININALKILAFLPYAISPYNTYNKWYKASKFNLIVNLYSWLRSSK